MGNPPSVLWRITKHTAKYAADDLSGGGAKLSGGRWNSKGEEVMYAASSIALAEMPNHPSQRIATDLADRTSRVDHHRFRRRLAGVKIRCSAAGSISDRPGGTAAISWQ